MTLRFPKDPLYLLLRDEKIDEFNSQRKSQKTIDFINCDFRGLNLRGIDASHINFSGSYFRASDLRGVDFSSSILEGASIASAKISGCLFPSNIRAEEISLSVNKGTRMRGD